MCRWVSFVTSVIRCCLPRWLAELDFTILPVAWPAEHFGINCREIIHENIAKSCHAYNEKKGACTDTANGNYGQEVLHVLHAHLVRGIITSRDHVLMIKVFFLKPV